MDNSNEITKKCKYCGMDIPADAGRCSYCGSLLEVSVDRNVFTGTPAEETPQNPETEAAGFHSGQQPENSANNGFQPGAAPQFNAGGVPNQGGNYRQDYRQQYKQPDYDNYNRKPLSNGLKVFLTVIFTLIPGLGQLAGIIAAIVFMNAHDDADRKSFGVALLVASVSMFVLTCIGCFGASLLYSVNQNAFYR